MVENNDNCELSLFTTFAYSPRFEILCQINNAKYRKLLHRGLYNLHGGYGGTTMRYRGYIEPRFYVILSLKTLRHKVPSVQNVLTLRAKRGRRVQYHLPFLQKAQ
jgi:hypothetical protein